MRYWFAVSVLALAGCGGPSDDGSHLDVTAAWLAGGRESPHLSVELDHRFGQQILDALHNGVTLRYEWRLQIHDADAAPWDAPISEVEGTIEVVYRTLTRAYSLTGPVPDQRVALPDVAAVEAALATLDVPLDPGGLKRPESGGEARFRIELDVSVLPPPLRLPAHLSAAWRQDSGWHSWPMPATTPDSSGLE
jgi:hypothetical protein